MKAQRRRPVTRRRSNPHPALSLIEWPSKVLRMNANPVPLSQKAKRTQEAARRYSEFTGLEAEYIDLVDIPGYPDVVFKVGTVDFIGYTTVREEKGKARVERYKHDFRESSRPLLAVSHDGKQLFIIGGKFVFTSAGITDK